MGEPLTVTVVVPNYDGARLLPACLAALRAQTRRADAIVVVDDASRDDSVALLARDFPEVRVVRLAKNRGFAGAVNAGIEVVTTNLVALLNNDAVAEPRWLEALLDAAERHPEFDAFACRMLKVDPTPGAPSRIDSAGLALARGFAQISIGDGEIDGPEFDGEREVLGACGGAALYRKRYLDELSGFDARYVAYFEDYDLALRGLLRGKRTLYIGAARVHHLGSATIGRHSDRGTQLYARNSIFLLATAVPLWSGLREYGFIVWSRLRMLALSARRGKLWPCFFGFVEGRVLHSCELVSRMCRPLVVVPGAEARLHSFLVEGERLRERSKRRHDAETTA